MKELGVAHDRLNVRGGAISLGFVDVTGNPATKNVKIRGEWAAADRSANYTLLEAPDMDTVRLIQAPFAPYTETVIVEVTALSGWTASSSTNSGRMSRFSKYRGLIQLSDPMTS